ncbi:coth-domain-containing protein [Anaeromyces robustus]|uniref:Coth-domain-containing protein n=1 Tax=Anaeromyces robustus TaxID=1754192 RepID=A0A1Y1X1I9_9FUNG|nr:coth-domain-containing protein [Anaeromyces robustus]|eukprot:ORX79488.1 coth-domain-containing protein [Anaeromyces robustus]
MKQSTILKPWGASTAPKYIANNVTSFEFFVKDTDYRVQLKPEQFQLQLGGSGSRNYVKPGYNIKLKKNANVYEVKSLRLRANIRDPILMREKLSSDMLYKMGIPATSINYVNFMVNDEDLGIYIVTNKIKKDFIQRYYGDDNPVNLFECKEAGSRFDNDGVGELCENVKEELNDQRDDIRAFNEAIKSATSVEEIEKVLDVDEFLKVVAFELLTVSWDHFVTYSHNVFWYKAKDGRWKMLLKDYDETFGQNFNTFVFEYLPFFANRTYVPKEDELNTPNISFRDLESDHLILKYLIHDDDTRFRKIIGDTVKKFFNPKVIFKRVDEIAELIRDDIEKSRDPDENGFAKGYTNTDGFNPKWTITQFDDCIGYVNWNSNNANTVSLGIKYFVQERFRYICHTYGIDPETLELIEPHDLVRYIYTDLDKEDYMQEEYNANPEKNNKPTNYVIPPFSYENEITNNAVPPTTPTTETPVVKEEEEEKEKEECWSVALGYPCCTSTCYVYETDTNGQWGYENKHWCGIPSTCSNNKCWSESLGYPCCTSTCNVYESNENGEWGYENHHWCGILKENC